MIETVGLADFLERLNWSPEKLAREVNRLCGDGTVSAKAPYHWLRGSYPRKKIPEAVARILSEHLKEAVEIDAIWPRSPTASSAPSIGHPPIVQESEITPLVKDSCNSVRLVQYASETNSDEATLDQLNRELGSVSSSYLHVPPGSLIYRVMMLRDRVARLLQGRQKLPQRRELLVLGAKFCTLLAWISEDLGDGKAAYNQASAASDLADLADDNEARRWVRGAQSRQSYWLRNFIESAQFAVAGMALESRDDLDLFLKLMAARAWAAAGFEREARRALFEWAELRDEEEKAHGVSIFHLSQDRQAYLAGHTWLSLNDVERALAELYKSLDWMTRLPAGQRFHAIEVLVRTDILRAQARRNDLDGASEIIGPIFDLEPEKMINMVMLALRRSRLELLRHFGDDRQCRDLANMIDEFLARSARDFRPISI
jgi:hypothetical protein